MKNYHLSQHALEDLQDIWEFISADSPRAADKVLDRIHSAMTHLARFPRMGRSRNDIRRDLRSYPLANYVIYYEPTKAGVNVVRILHGSRDISAIGCGSL